jgi:predicted dehydrogenase
MAKIMNRRSFIATSAVAAVGTVLSTVPLLSSVKKKEEEKSNISKKVRIALVGTGSRGTGMWGKDVLESYGDRVEYVGLCDINPGRVEAAKKYMGATCKTYTDFELMMKETTPEILIVTTKDGIHDQFIIRGMELGCDILTEKPLTTDETKCQAIMDAQKRTGKKITVTFNYRFSPHRAKIWQLLRSGEIGDIKSVDFHWYLDTSHGADYFRRWHRLRQNSGSLLVHKASHHFDLLNWWIDSDPEEVFAFGALDFYGKNGKQRATNCRTCNHQQGCDFYWNVDKDAYYKMLYTDNEKYDGYLRDGCVFKEDIDIFDKMNASIKYANGVDVSYSLTAYAPYEGYRIAFNGTKGRIDAWIQEKNPVYDADYDEIMITRNFGKRSYVRVTQSEGHGGGDALMKDKIFKKTLEDPFRQTAGIRDGAMAILIGIAARKSIDSGKPVLIGDLTELKPLAKKI